MTSWKTVSTPDNAPPSSSRVLLAYLHPNEVAASFHKSLLNLIGYDISGPRRLHTWIEVKAAAMSIPEGRNDACRQLLANDDCEWLFFLDSDMGFEPWTLEMLLTQADPKTRPIVGGLCFANREMGSDGMNGMLTYPAPTLLDYVRHDDGIDRFTGRHHFPVNALVETGATGCACLLVHRSVIERVKTGFGEVWFERIREPQKPGGSLRAWMGEDISFFDRCRQMAVPLHVHTGIRTTHMKQNWISEADFWQSFIAPPATERVDVLVPVLHRPQNIERFMSSLRASTGLATAWFICDENDAVEQREAADAGAEVLSFPDCHSFSEKVNAAYTYTGMRSNPAKWVLLVGDDVRFRPGWLDHAEDVARRYDGEVIGTNDLSNPRVMRGEHATHPLIARSYVDELGASFDGPGVVCHEGYRHWCVDDEIVTLAKKRRAFYPALGSHVEHMHPFSGKGEDDEVYAAGARHAKADKELYEARVIEFCTPRETADAGSRC